MKRNLARNSWKHTLSKANGSRGRNRHPHRPDPNPGCHRHDGHAGAGSDGSGSRQTELSAQYVDHNLLQEDFKNPDDHLFLQAPAGASASGSARPGTASATPCTRSDSANRARRCWAPTATPAPPAPSACWPSAPAGSRSALAMAGEPFHFKMPKIWGVKLTAKLPDWVSAKDVILEMLRRHGVNGGVGRIIEYHGPGLACFRRDGPSRDRQHGGRTGRHHHGFSLRRRGAALSSRARAASRIGSSWSPIAGAGYDVDGRNRLVASWSR